MKKMYPFCLIFLLASYLPFLNQGSVVINSYIFMMLGLSLWQYRYKKKMRSFVRVALMVGGGALIFNEYQTFWGLEPGVAFLTLLATLKTFELSGPRDFFIFVLIVELSLSAHVLTVDALYMVIYVLGLSLALFALLFTFHTEGVEKAWARPRRKVFLKIFLLSLPMAFCLFMLFPRMTLGNFFFNTMKKIHDTGFTEELKPGSISEVIKSRAPFFRATFFDDKTPSIFELYWRGAILTQTDGFSWKRGRPGVSKEEKVIGPVRFRYSVDYDRFTNGPIFLLGDNLKYVKKSKGYVLNLGGDTFKFFPYSNQKIKYTAETGRRKVGVLSAKTSQTYLSLPEESNFPRFKQWSESLELEGKSLRKKINVFSKYLKKQGFSYSLSPGSISGRAPLDQFFFDRKLGLCEHFASSLAIFLRMQGVPSRVVVGFHGGILNPMGDYFLITGQDAHAWVEAWDKKRGWQRIDPTNWLEPDRIRFGSDAYFATDAQRRSEPMDIFLRRQNNEFFRKALFAFDMIYFELNREFVGFSLDRQAELFSFLGVKDKLWHWKLILLCGVVVSLILAPLSYWLYKSRQKKNPVDVVYSEYEKLLSKYQLSRFVHEGPLDHLARCQVIKPELSTVLDEFTQKYIAAKYGPNAENYTQSELGPLKLCLSQVKKSLVKSAKVN